MLYAYKNPKILNFEAVFSCIFFRHHIFLRSIKYRAVTRHITPLPTHIVQPGGSTMCLTSPPTYRIPRTVLIIVVISLLVIPIAKPFITARVCLIMDFWGSVFRISLLKFYNSYWLYFYQSQTTIVISTLHILIHSFPLLPQIYQFPHHLHPFRSHFTSL